MSFVKIFSLAIILIINVNDFAVSQSSYTCPAANVTIEFTLVDPLSISHSAADLLFDCSVSQCANNGNTTCLSSQTPCFRYLTADNISHCAPASLCSLLQPCDNITGTCSSNTSVCIINSCCLPKSVCLPLSWTTLCPSAEACQLSLAPTRTYTMNTSASAIVSGDFNSDYLLDLIVSHYDIDMTSLYLGTENGTFTYHSTFETGRVALYINVADFDNDAHLDLAILNAAGATISLLFGDGNGGFAPRITLPTGTDMQSITSGDLNNDGVHDLIVGNGRNGTIDVYLSFGNRSFASPIVHILGESPETIAVGDLDNDFNRDLVVGLLFNQTTWILYTLFGRGDGTFDNGTTLLTVNRPIAVVVEDFNGDYLLDIAAVNDNNSLDIFIGDGNGTFTIETSIDTYSDACHLAVADMNADFQLDLVIIDPYNHFAIFLGFGNGSFAAPAIFSKGDSACNAALADFNNDGLTDFAVTNMRSPGVDVTLNSCSCCIIHKV